MSILQEPKWLSEMRSSASEKFSVMQIPQEREESWRYTDLKQLGIDNNSFNANESEISFSDSVDGIIFTNLLDAMQNHSELVKNHLGKLITPTDKITAYHYSSLMDGVFVYVPDGRKAALSNKINGSSHTIIITGRNSELDYEELHSGSGFSTNGVEIFAGENSRINFLSIQKCSDQAKMFSFKDAKLSRDAKLNLFLGTTGAALHRNDVNIFLEGEGAGAETLCGIKSKSTQHSDFMIKCHHKVPRTWNNITTRTTVDDKASSVFRGIIKIDKDAQQTDSFLEDHALLLSDEATANNIPSLEIDANDVKAKHGATVGQIDEEQLFYLMSRGLSREEAESLIVKGFFEPLINKIKNPEFADKFRKAFE